MTSASLARAGGLGRTTLTGACAVLVGLGLSRFAYTPLLPALVAAKWFSPQGAALLSAANLIGYLAGAVAARRMAGGLIPARLLHGLMVLATACFFACAWPLSFPWMFFWRFCSGLAGGGLVVLAAPTLLARLPAASRGLASGLIFTGVGVGIITSGTLVPALVSRGLAQAWIGLGAVALLLTLVAWGGWHDETGDAAPEAPAAADGRFVPLYAAYSLNGVGLVPHMAFLADFVARGLGQGVAAGAHLWVVYGLGAACGPLSAGLFGARFGFRAALRLAFVAQAGAALLPALAQDRLSLTLSAFVMGAFTPGIGPIVIGRLGELAGGDARRQRAAWGTATLTYAVVQAVTAFAYSALFERVGYAPLFLIAAVALTAALLIELKSGR
jgi:predicted MFS family arabinose efflux permease